MPHPTSSTATPQSRRLTAARSAMRGSAPVKVGRGAKVDQRFIAASVNYRQCAQAYIRARDAWHSFAATHAADDQGHQEHHDRVVQSRLALVGAEEAFSLALHSVQG